MQHEDQNGIEEILKKSKCKEQRSKTFH